ncbi:MAG: flagellar M-ring protein FliF, partial [Deltaproteobacteria bacterium]|nr:flagellar M-ring protein FliF [Deltaproteobacteria bacterium]
MGEFLTKVFNQILEFTKGLSIGKKLAVVLTGAGIVVALVALFYWAGEKTYQPLATNVAPEEAANVIRILRDKHIPFKVDSTGKNILVPPESLLELRLELAALGLPQVNVVGYEIFDKQSLGTTSFVQKMNQKRALEGELMRTIGSIKGVRRSRVHLAIPQKSAFVEDQKKPSASVVLDLEPGVTLAEKQIYGISNLVSRAIEGMDQQEVVIVDSNGKMLSKNIHDPLTAVTATQFDFRQKYEEDLEKRIEGLLSKIVGEGRVAVRVNSEIDFSQVNETQTIYDPDGSAIRSIQKNTKTMEGNRPGPGGLPGQVSNTPGQPPAQNTTQALNRSETKMNDETTNFEIPQTIRKTLKPSGTAKKLSIAVLVDGKTVKTKDKDGKVETKIEPWPPEKLKEFEDLVTMAAGIDKKRGDTLEIKNMEFTHEDFDEAQKIILEQEKKTYFQNLIVYVVVGLIILLFFFLVVRPFIKWVTENTTHSVDAFLPQTIEELEKIQKTQTLPEIEEVIPVLPDKVDPEKVEGDMIKEKIVTLVDTNPHKAALILRDWLHAEAIKKEKSEKEGGAATGKAKTA